MADTYINILGAPRASLGLEDPNNSNNRGIDTPSTSADPLILNNPLGIGLGSRRSTSTRGSRIKPKDLPIYKSKIIREY